MAAHRSVILGIWSHWLIDKREILDLLDLAVQTSLTPHVILKDYVLGWMLAGIYAHEELAESWIFKGGTCLKKCFFETYRFSEDLDFTLRSEAHLDEAFLKRVFAEVGAWIYDETGIEIPAISRNLTSTQTLAARSHVRARSAIRDRFHPRDPFRGSSST
jgi:predicted nucleotidyltransferase component of viral defense system